MTSPFATAAQFAAALALSTVAAFAGGATAPVADAPLASPAAAAPASPFDGFWGGVSFGKGYSAIGVESGIAVDELADDILSLGYPDSGASGAAFGLEAGYARSFGSNLQWGVQLDHMKTDVAADAIFRIALTNGEQTVADDFGYRVSVTSMTSALGRIGYRINDTAMIYGLGGITAARIAAKIEGLSATKDISNFDAAAFTFGVGIETVVAEKTTLKLEYRSTNFGTHEFENVDGSIGDQPLNFHASASSHVDSVRVVLVRRF